MRKVEILIIYLLAPFLLKGQQGILINQYRDYNSQFPPFYKSILNHDLDFGIRTQIVGQGYSGEYEIYLTDDFCWRSQTSSAYYNNAITYSMEVIGFPFTMDCAFLSTSCADCSSLERKLNLPLDAYIPQDKKWGNYLHQYFEGRFPAGSNALSYIPSPDPQFTEFHQSLVSTFFNRDNFNVNFVNRYTLPHSVIKINMYLHCDATYTSDIIATISFNYDNTRGRMRHYPFRADNCDVISHSDYDVIFLPACIVDKDPISIIDVYYDESDTNGPWTDGVGTIVNYPLNANGNNCNYPIPNLGDLYHGAGFSSTFPQPGPYALFSNILFDYQGTQMAGYDLDPLSLEYNNTPGMKHAYYIKDEFDLTILNPEEKVIYNPEEVILEPYPTTGYFNLTFPSGYTFKTIHGNYPNFNDVTTANIPSNGGPFMDLLQVPVRTNLRNSNSAYPNDPLNPEHSVYASIYKLENLSRLTVQPCVKIFDATFDVQQGGTLIFEDYPSTKNPDRFKLIGNGGVIAKNLSPYQYLQNTIVTQTQPIDYTAFTAIYAGTNVDPDVTVTDNPYIINPGADVKFVSEGEIVLQDGFDVLDGASFDAFIDVLGIPQPCDPPPPSSQNRIIGQNGISTSGDPFYSGVRVYPNPGTGMFTAEISGKIFNSTWTIKNIHNQTIASGNSPLNKFDFNLESAQSGIYILAVQSENTTQFARVVKQ